MKNYAKKMNKHRIFLIGFFTALLLITGSFYSPFVKKASAATTLCYTLTQSGYYRSTTCIDDPSIDKNTDSAATDRCYFQVDTAQRQGKTTFSVKSCTEIRAANQNCINNKCYPNATVDGGGNAASTNPDTNASFDQLPTTKPPACKNNGSDKALQDCLSKNPIIIIVLATINVLSAGVGIVVVIMIIIGGIQYSASGGNPQTVAEAKKKIYNAIIALIAFLFMFSFLQWLVPGGIL